MKSNTLRYEDIPNGWPLCFLSKCPNRTKCLHFVAGEIVPDDVLMSASVMPGALKAKQCPFFRPIEVVRVALGFKGIFDIVRTSHAKNIRLLLSQYLGGNGSYYRYLRGDKALMPEQQRWIRHLLIQYGYDEPFEFDDYKETFRFYNE